MPWPVFSRPVFATGFNRWCTSYPNPFIFPSRFSRLQPVLRTEQEKRAFTPAQWPVFSRPAFATGFNRWWTGYPNLFILPSRFSRLQPVLLPEQAK